MVIDTQMFDDDDDEDDDEDDDDDDEDIQNKLLTLCVLFLTRIVKSFALQRMCFPRDDALSLFCLISLPE